MKSFLAAWQFLTVFPIPARFVGAANGSTELATSARWFPAVGLILGLICAVLDRALLHFLPVSVASVLIAIILSYASGGLHMDGLADTADGFMSSRPRDRILEIMRDSRSGPMGVLAVVSVLVVKVAALTSIQGDIRGAALILSPVLGRMSALFLMCRLSYARKEGGLATVFLDTRLSRSLVINLLALGIIAFAIAGFTGIIWIASAAVGAEIFARLCQRKIQGFTGDTLGASCESIEALCWVVASSGRILP